MSNEDELLLFAGERQQSAITPSWAATPTMRRTLVRSRKLSQASLNMGFPKEAISRSALRC